MNKIYALILPILGIASATFTIPNAENTYNGVQITPQTMVKLAQAPADVAASFQEFNQNHPALCTVLTKFEPKHFYQNHKDAAQALKDADIANLTRGNFVFKLPKNPNLIVQVAGQASRIYNTSCDINGIGNGWNHCYNKWFKGQDLDALKNSSPITYQTVSRAANYLMLKQALTKIESPRVSIFPSWILPINPTANHETANDNTHVVVQQAHGPEFIQINDQDPLKTAANVTLLSDKALLDVCALTAAVKLFNVGSNLLVNPTTGDAGMIDYEQPNHTGPSLFFNNRTNKISADYEHGNKGKTLTEHNAGEGFDSIYRLLDARKNPAVASTIKDNLNKKFSLVQNFTQSDPVFKQYSSQGYQEIIAKLDSHK